LAGHRWVLALFRDHRSLLIFGNGPLNEATRAWSKRFFARAGRMPGMVQAGTYSSVTHYLKSMQVAGTTEGAMVAAQMHALPVDDFFHDFFLAEVERRASLLHRGTTTRSVASSRRRRRPSHSRDRSARSSGSSASGLGVRGSMECVPNTPDSLGEMQAYRARRGFPPPWLGVATANPRLAKRSTLNLKLRRSRQNPLQCLPLGGRRASGSSRIDAA
jgi:Periplasmic binding protein